jgi:hypothetical protein
MKLKQIEAILNTNESFKAHVLAEDTHPNNVAVELIGLAYELGGDFLGDDELLDIIAAILERTTHLLNEQLLAAIKP